jgi:Peptidase family S41
VFYSLPQVSLGPHGVGNGTFTGGGRGGIEYPGSSTSIKFENGTRFAFENHACVKKNFSGVSSGADVYAKWLLVKDDMSINLQHGENLTSDSRFPVSVESSSTKEIPAPGYPKHVSRMKSNEAGGYYLDGYGYNDIAVLTVYSFVEDGGDHLAWQNTTRQFLSQAKTDGKKRLIIDLSVNAGGTVLLGYDLFAQLFPDIKPYGGNRFRAHQAWNEMGKMASVFSANISRSMATVDRSSWKWVAQSMNYRSDLDESGEPFTSWTQKYGPHAANGDFHTTTQRWNLDDPIGEYLSQVKNLTGHGLPTLDFGWKPEDMVVLYDGYCSSTCAIFSEFMRRQAGVETIAMGGRPSKDIIQAVGGTKGTNVWPWSHLLWFVLSMHEKADAALKASWVGTEMDAFNTFLPFKRASQVPHVNMRDGVRPGGDPTPLQFIVEPADCRLYYTPAMVVDITKMWIAAADTKWLGKRRCVAGGFKNVPSSLPD